MVGKIIKAPYSLGPQLEAKNLLVSNGANALHFWHFQTISRFHHLA
jgi:hypothetical protein